MGSKSINSLISQFKTSAIFIIILTLQSSMLLLPENISNNVVLDIPVSFDNRYTVYPLFLKIIDIHILSPLLLYRLSDIMSIRSLMDIGLKEYKKAKRFETINLTVSNLYF